MTERSLQAIADDGMARFDVSAVSVAHRCGAIAPGETIVFVATIATHRAAAFAAAEFLMDYLKTRAPFWKKVERGDGTHWVEAHEKDDVAAGRWNEKRDAAE
jgi:molybdopterin synthase catalytic subunit